MIRAATVEEAKLVARFFEGVEDGLSVHVFADLEPAIVERAGDLVVVLASAEALALPAPLLEEADHGGLRIGTLEDGGFALDLQGAVRMSAYTRRQTVRVTEQATRVFLYGKPILGDSVKSFDPRLNPGDICIVSNLRWEAIGLGEVMGRFKGDRPAVLAVHDLGTYLRDQDED